MMGSKVRQLTIKREADFLDYIEKARVLVKTPLVLMGGFRSAQAMQAALNSGAPDFIWTGENIGD